MSKFIVFFDLETTGPNLATDRIVAYSFIKIDPDTLQHVDQISGRCNPGIPISPEATAVHGIKDEDVSWCPTFESVCDTLYSFLDNCDLGGYNILNFDVPVLVEELMRAGYYNFPRDGTRYIDVFQVYKHFHSQSLSAAFKNYFNMELENAHDADADIKATVDVFRAQKICHAYQLGYGLAGFIELSEEASKNRVDFAGKLAKDEKGYVIYSIGKAKGERILDNPGFGQWMLRQDWITNNTAKILTDIMEGRMDAYGKPVTVIEPGNNDDNKPFLF